MPIEVMPIEVIEIRVGERNRMRKGHSGSRWLGVSTSSKLQTEYRRHVMDERGDEEAHENLAYHINSWHALRRGTREWAA